MSNVAVDVTCAYRQSGTVLVINGCNYFHIQTDTPTHSYVS